MKYVILSDDNVEEGSNDSFYDKMIMINNCDTFKLNSNSNSKLKKLIGPILLNTQSSITIKENRFKMHLNFLKRR